jgi:L-ascorbate metabolism protein UlaG (beta-lactamase superfamily)
MQIQLIRSATLRFDYVEKSFIIDPYLAAKHTRPSFTSISPNPLVDLPSSPLEAITGIEMVRISHLHSDHFDPVAQDLLPKDITIFCQPEDKAEIESTGFRNVIPVTDAVNWQGITITRTPCQHGTGEVLKEMGNASGFVFSSANTVASPRSIDKMPVIRIFGRIVMAGSQRCQTSSGTHGAPIDAIIMLCGRALP